MSHSRKTILGRLLIEKKRDSLRGFPKRAWRHRNPRHSGSDQQRASGVARDLPSDAVCRMGKAELTEWMGKQRRQS